MFLNKMTFLCQMWQQYLNHSSRRPDLIGKNGLLIRNQQLKLLQERLLPTWIQNLVSSCYYFYNCYIYFVKNFCSYCQK